MQRLRQLRQSDQMRHLMQENFLQLKDLIAPLFVSEPNEAGPIKNFFDVCRLNIDQLKFEVETLSNLGVKTIMLFPKIANNLKNATGSYCLEANNILFRAIHALKQEKFPILLLADVALDPYTDHGHDGLLNERGGVANDTTIEMLCQQALMLAQAGVDGVCPSDMMDGRVKAIRSQLDAHGFFDTLIVSYACKFASNFYGPFRQAVGSNLIGHKKSYQLNFANKFEAIQCAKRDINEGAAIIIVKPALSYLDIITEVKQLGTPVWAYQVSGEYVMLAQAAAAGAFNFTQSLFETVLSAKRAGARGIITYGAKLLAQSLANSNT